MELISRIRTFDNGVTIRMSKEFLNSVFWKDIDLWVKLFGLRQEKEERQNGESKVKSVKSRGIKGFFSSIIQKATVNSHAERIRKKIEKVIPNSKLIFLNTLFSKN